MKSNSSWIKASLQQPTSVLFGEYSTTIGLLQQNEKSTQNNVCWIFQAEILIKNKRRDAIYW